MVSGQLAVFGTMLKEFCTISKVQRVRCYRATPRLGIECVSIVENQVTHQKANNMRTRGLNCSSIGEC